MAWPFIRRNQRNALTASVTTVPHEKGRITQKRSRDAGWQKEAWAFYHDLGEVRFCARYMGNTLARVRFFVGTRDHPGDPVVPIPDDASGEKATVRDILSRIKGRDGTFQSLTRTYGVHRFIAGESFLVGEDGLEGETWEFLSTSELRRMQRGQGALSDLGADAEAGYERDKGGGDYVQINDESLVLRFWSRDPEFRDRADSPLRPVLDLCEALHTAQMMQTAGDRSRLATMGLFLVPAEADLPKAPVTDNPGHPAQQPRLMLMDSLLEAMNAAMEAPGSVAAISPILVEAKAEYIDKFKRVMFDREVDKTIVARIDHLIRRFAQGVDLPPEILLGIGDANHWSAWAVSEQTVSAHVAPMAAEFAEDLDVGFLRPTLDEMAVKDPDQYAIGFDVTDLVTSPDRAQHAITLYDRYELGAEELLEALGFDPSMRPDLDEIIHRIMVARASNPRNPDPGPDIAALQGKAPPPTGAEKPVPGNPNAPTNPQEPPPNAPDPNADKVSGGPDDASKQAPVKSGDAKTVAPPKSEKAPSKAESGKQAPQQQKGQQAPPTNKAKTPKAGQKAPKKGKTAKTAAAARMVGEIDIAIDGLMQLDDVQFASAVDSSAYFTRLAGRLATEVSDLDIAERVVDGVRMLARAARENPGTNTWDASMVLCEAALFDPDDLEDEDDEVLV